jgi:hypothetical protein
MGGHFLDHLIFANTIWRRKLYGFGINPLVDLDTLIKYKVARLKTQFYY